MNNKFSRLMGIDFGEKRIGIAMSDLLKILASPLETYFRKDLEADLAHIANLIAKNDVEIVVFGLPLQMDGQEGEIAKKTREFADLLSKRISVGVVYIDERLTSVEAEEILIESGKRRDERKKLIDSVAATLILESYMNSNKY